MSDTIEQSLTPPPRIGPLNNMRRVREELTRVYKDARLGVLDTQDASRLTFILMSLARVIQGGELDQRMAAIEQKLSRPQDNGAP